MDSYPRPFRPGPIEPVVQVGQQVLLVQTTKYRLYSVAFIEPIPPSHPLVANLGAPGAGAVLAAFSTTAILDMQDGELAQLRCYVLDDIHVVLQQPQSTTRGLTMNQTARINAFTALMDPCHHLTETFILEQNRIFLTGQNPTQYALTQARVAFYGFRYVLSGDEGEAPRRGAVKPMREFDNIKGAVASGEKFTVIPVGGWGR